MVKRLVAGVLLALVTLQGELRAQSYESEARELSSLYRGRLQNTYHYRYNGTYYMFTRAFGRESVLYNGKRYDKSYIDYRDIIAGGTLELTMGSKPSKWGTNKKNRP